MTITVDEANELLLLAVVTLRCLKMPAAIFRLRWTSLASASVTLRHERHDTRHKTQESRVKTRHKTQDKTQDTKDTRHQRR